MSFHEKSNMYPGVESIHKKMLSQSLEWDENVNYDRDFIQCFRNLRPQGLWHAINSRSGDPGFLLAFRYFLSTHSTPLKNIWNTENSKIFVGVRPLLNWHILSYFLTWLFFSFLLCPLTFHFLPHLLPNPLQTCSAHVVPILSGTNRLVPQLPSLLPLSHQIIHSTFKVSLWQTSWENSGVSWRPELIFTCRLSVSSFLSCYPTSEQRPKQMI